MSAIQYLNELEAKSTDYALRVQIACAQAIVEAIREQTAVIKESLKTQPKLTALWHPSRVDIEEQAERLSKAEAALREIAAKVGRTDECGWYDLAGDFHECDDDQPPEDWCSVCIARRYFAAKGGER